MNKISCPDSWLLLDLVYDSFIYRNNKPLSNEVHRFVLDNLYRMNSGRLYDYDAVEHCLEWLVISDRVTVSYDYVEQEERYSRVDLMGCPSFVIG